MRTRLSRITGFLAIAGAFCCSCEETEKSILESVSIEPASLELTAGSTAVLELRAVPETYIMKGEVIWSSSDPSVVTVDEKGIASGVKEGTASVTAAVDGKEARCDITVVSEVTSFSIDPAQADMVVGDILQLKAVTVPDGIDGEVLWSSSDESVAAVSAAGEVSAVSAGNVTVTASFKDLTAECEISVSDPEPAKVGDFFYDDGTWSSDLREDKTCIGVVFYTGNPAVHDESLKREHPDCVNGLVIGAFADEPNYWQSAVYDCGISVGEWIRANVPSLMPPLTGTLEDDGLNRMVGFSNTQALIAFDADESNSGWYIPSVKELSLLCSGEYDGNIWNMQMPDVSNLERVNASLAKISRHSPIIGTSYYWSSSEYSALEALGLDMLSGKVAYTVKDTYPWRIRCVLAF